MKTIAKYTAFMIAAFAVLYICIAGGELTMVIAILLMVGITAIAVALMALAILREIYREIIKPLAAAIRRAF